MDSDITWFLTGMIVINTTSLTTINLSTTAISGVQPRARGGVPYVPNYDDHGILVAIGGIYGSAGENPVSNHPGFTSSNEVSIYDIDAVYRNDSDYDGWFS
ncbi:hypothetical protein K431DRAFT_293279 [Polychaeton citri CBS 116435]|uniref:Uncharacterized protein n=1 Tax=Polychaeton citri CBS 116435 TaxID=1314669 RepID=A0A9P4QD59_9PEZI|nr:hypothetical protein K431DRAFT_293279 [Polychaeton citri CBS 116435]